MTLTITNLKASIPGREILRGVDLVVPDGEVHAVAPPMVAGRSRDEIREATVLAVLDLLRLRLESRVTDFGV